MFTSYITSKDFSNIVMNFDQILSHHLCQNIRQYFRIYIHKIRYIGKSIKTVFFLAHKIRLFMRLEFSSWESKTADGQKKTKTS